MHTKFLAAVMMLASPTIGCALESDPEPSSSGSTSQALGVTGPAFYAEGDVYRTVNTPTEFSADQLEHSMDTIYDLGGLQLNVAAGAPGVPGFNGGRWEVHAISFTDYEAALAMYDANGSGTFDFASEVEAASAAGDATDEGVVKRFECPVIKLVDK